MSIIVKVFNGDIAIAISTRAPLRTLGIIDTFQMPQFQDFIKLIFEFSASKNI